MRQLLFAIWFFLPAGLANAVPVVAAKTPLLKNWEYPMDFNRQYRGKRIFGEHKTWRGFLTGVTVATLVVALQHYLYSHSPGVRPLFDTVDYSRTAILWLGPLLGGGALLGDAVKSFFKRRVSVGPGETWFPFDQLDYIVGGLLASLLFVRLPVAAYAAIVAVWFGLHVLTVYVCYHLGIRDKPI